MYLAIHVPMFGSPNIEAKLIECPTCPRGVEHGANDWDDVDISQCSPGDCFKCSVCGTIVTANWGLVEPDHLSNWKNSEHCPHRLCRLLAEKLQATR
jgi:hypothetical protein